jgi:hypothetical protein
MPRLCSLVLLVLLASVQLGGSCSSPDAIPLEELQKDSLPPFDYALYCDEKGTLVGNRSAVLLVYRASHLERVYADSLAGNSRAQALFGQLETTVRATGKQLARQSLGIACGSLPACVVQWHKLDEFMPSRGEGGMRLRQSMADSFSLEAKRQQVRNTTTAAMLDVLLVGSVLRQGVAGATEAQAATADARSAAAEAATPVESGRLALAGLEAQVAAEELPALELRLAEAEALVKEPLVTDNTGLQLEGRANPVYVDQLAVDHATLGPGRQPSVHSFSNKQHDFAGSSVDEARAQLKIDSLEATTKYGGLVEVRRLGHPLFGQKVRVSQVHIVYDGTGLSSELKDALLERAPRHGVQLHFYVP